MADLGISSSVDELLLAALQRGGDTSKTGRHLVTFKAGGMEAGMQSMQSVHSLRVASSRDFADHAVNLEQVEGADVFSFPEIGVALMSGEAATSRGMTTMDAANSDTIQSVDPEYFVFSNAVNSRDYLRGAMRALQTAYADLLVGDLGAYRTDPGPSVVICRRLHRIAQQHD